MKKNIALFLCLLLIIGIFSGCGNSDTPAETTPAAPSTEPTKPKIPSVRYLNFQPELESAWLDLAAAYTADTGVPVTVITEKPDNWQQTLDSLLSGEDAPTLFQLIRPTADDGWKELCYDLSDTDAGEQLVHTDFALTDEDAVWALPCSLNVSGIWVNKTLLAQAGFNAEDITSQNALKAACEAITENAETLNFSAFSGVSPDACMSLAADAIALEFQQENLSDPADFRGTALEGLQSLIDTMLLNRSETPDAFLAGKAVFFPGTGADWAALSEVFSAEELALIPAFLDKPEEVPEETTPEETAETQPTEETQPEETDPQGLCIGADTYWCVNPDAPEQDLDATLDFLDWCLGTEEGAAAVAALGYDLPYLTAPESTNPFLPEAASKDLLHRRDWAVPSRQWKTALLDGLSAYIAEPSDVRWARVAAVFADYWAAEYALSTSEEETQP